MKGAGLSIPGHAFVITILALSGSKHLTQLKFERSEEPTEQVLATPSSGTLNKSQNSTFQRPGCSHMILDKTTQFWDLSSPVR